MTRLARIVVPDAPHHVTQRGNRREPIFFWCRRILRILVFCILGRDDGLVIVKPILDLVGDLAKLLAPFPGDEEAFVRIRLAESTGRPLANAEFIDLPFGK
jgi:hypothetical protein